MRVRQVLPKSQNQLIPSTVSSMGTVCQVRARAWELALNQLFLPGLPGAGAEGTAVANTRPARAMRMVATATERAS